MRITTRYDEMDPLSAICGVLHETGHALYEQNLPRAYRRQPVGEAAGMATHESQSLIVEMQAVRSDAYLAYLGPDPDQGLRQARQRSGAETPFAPRGAQLHPRRGR